MSYPITDREIRELIRDRVVSTPLARAIVRKSDFRAGAPALGVVSDVNGHPILPLPAITYGASAAGTYFHPANLPYYITKWDLSAASEMKVSATVVSMVGGEASAALKAVYSETHEQIISGDWAELARVEFDSSEAPAFYVGEWTPILPELGAGLGDFYVGVLLEVNESGFTSLALGQTEVRIR